MAILVIIVAEIISISIDRAQHKLLGGGGGGGDLYDGLPPKVLLMTQLLLLGKFEYTGGPIFKVVLEC